MNNRKESGSRDTRTLSSGLHTIGVKIRSRHVIFLYNRGEYETVGSYFRNSVMAVAETNPVGHVRICNERSGKTEGFMAVTKSTTAFGARPYRRGRRWFERSCHFTFFGKIFAALVRLQHGIKSHLGSLTYIT